MRFRKLRIAWSVAWGLACVLLIVLWVRSYWTLSAINITGLHRFVLLRGYVHLDETIQVVSVRSEVSTHELFGYSVLHISEQLGTAVPQGAGNKFPVWPPIITVAAIAIGPFVRRFSLRTLLIATTLVAIALAAIMYAAR
jgi:hypothetical protein